MRRLRNKSQWVGLALVLAICGCAPTSQNKGTEPSAPAAFDQKNEYARWHSLSGRTQLELLKVLVRIHQRKNLDLDAWAKAFDREITVQCSEVCSIELQTREEI